MTRPPPRNPAASIHRRLLDGTRERGEDAQFILHRYAAERLLYRLGQSRHREQLVLKGAMLFALWGGSAYRPTRDLDFTGCGSGEIAEVLRQFREICEVTVQDDGMVFDADTLAAEAICDDTEYGGLRIVFEARLGDNQIRMQVDVGFGDAIEPPATEAVYPTLLDAPAPHIRAYPPEAVVAEKLHAMVVLGERNSRSKDFYDLCVIAQRFPFNGNRLGRAIGATFARRRTEIRTTIPAALTPRFFADESRARQWNAYLRRNALPGAPSAFGSAGEILLAFLVPPWRALADGRSFSDAWPPAGPWRSAPTTPEPD